MPKLNSATATKVEEAEGGNFEAMPEGIYNAVLDGEVEQADGANGVYWKWTFKITDEGYDGRNAWLNTSLSEKAMWKLKEVFEAFGVAADTDTDDLIGKPVKLMIVQKIIGGGNRKGETGNEIRQVLPHNQVTTDAPGDKAAGSKTKSKSKPAEDDVPLF